MQLAFSSIFSISFNQKSIIAKRKYSTTHVIHTWNPCDTLLKPMRYTSETHVIHFWNPCDTFLKPVWYTSETHAIHFWNPCDTLLQIHRSRLSIIWYISSLTLVIAAWIQYHSFFQIQIKFTFKFWTCVPNKSAIFWFDFSCVYPLLPQLRKTEHFAVKKLVRRPNKYNMICECIKLKAISSA